MLSSPAAFLASLPRVFRTVALATAVMFALPGTGGVGPETQPPAASIIPASVRYEVTAGLDGEIYPVFANYASMKDARERIWGTVAVKVENSSGETLRNRIAVEVPGWSDLEVQTVELGAGESRTYFFAPVFRRRMYGNREIAAGSAAVTVTDASGRVVDQETIPVHLRAVDDLYWGRDFEYAPFIASWVTPHDPAVERVLARAKEFMPGRRLPGYESSNPAVQDRSTMLQATAIYRALQEDGVSYVKSSMTLGGHEEFSERIRMPAESLEHSSANCIDGVVLYAALFENLGMDPQIVLVPGHAYVGVRMAPRSKRYLYIETSLTGRTSFRASVASARKSMAKFKASDFLRIDIRQARLDGIYPMPDPATDSRTPVLDASRTLGHAGS